MGLGSTLQPPSVTPLHAQALAPGSDTKLDIDTLEAVAGSAPLVELPAGQVLGQTLTDVMVAIKLQESKSAGRRLIKVPLSNNVQLSVSYVSQGHRWSSGIGPLGRSPPWS